MSYLTEFLSVEALAGNEVYDFLSTSLFGRPQLERVDGMQQNHRHVEDEEIRVIRQHGQVERLGHTGDVQVRIEV